MPRPREHPYIWATWLAKLLASQDPCEWAGWFRAHYQDWTKPPSDFDSTQWMLNHTPLSHAGPFPLSRHPRPQSDSKGKPPPSRVGKSERKHERKSAGRDQPDETPRTSKPGAAGLA